MSIMQPLYPGHVPMTDIELFQAFNIRCEVNGKRFWLWNVEPRIKYSKKGVDNKDANATIVDTDRAARINRYRARVEAGQTLFEDE